MKKESTKKFSVYIFTDTPEYAKNNRAGYVFDSDDVVDAVYYGKGYVESHWEESKDRIGMTCHVIENESNTLMYECRQEFGNMQIENGAFKFKSFLSQRTDKNIIEQLRARYALCNIK